MLFLCKKGKGSPYSITEHRVLQLIQVLGSQPAGGMSHKPGGRLSLLSARPAVTPATIKRVATNFAARWTESRCVWTVCLRLLPDSAVAAILSRALVRLSPARQPLGYRATTCVCIYAAAWVLAGGGWADVSRRCAVSVCRRHGLHCQPTAAVCSPVRLSLSTVCDAPTWLYTHTHPDRQPRHHPTTLVFYRPDALPAAQPTASKHWRLLSPYNALFLQICYSLSNWIFVFVMICLPFTIGHSYMYCRLWICVCGLIFVNCVVICGDSYWVRHSECSRCWVLDSSGLVSSTVHDGLVLKRMWTVLICVRGMHRCGTTGHDLSQPTFTWEMTISWHTCTQL